MRHPTRHSEGDSWQPLYRYASPLVRDLSLYVSHPTPAAVSTTRLRPAVYVEESIISPTVRRYQCHSSCVLFISLILGLLPPNRVLGIYCVDIRHPTHTNRPHPQCRTMVVLLRRDVRQLPRLLPRRILAAPLVLRRRALDPHPFAAASRAHDPRGHLRHLQAVSQHRRHHALPRHGASLPARVPAHAVHVPVSLHGALLHVPRARVLLPVDLRRQRERQLLLRHHARVESRPELAR